MKTKDLLELKAKSIKEIRSNTRNLEKEKVNAQLELKMAKNKNVHLFAQTKKSIAQTLTVLHLKEILEREKGNQNIKSGGKNAEN